MAPSTEEGLERLKERVRNLHLAFSFAEAARATTTERSPRRKRASIHAAGSPVKRADSQAGFRCGSEEEALPPRHERAKESVAAGQRVASPARAQKHVQEPEEVQEMRKTYEAWSEPQLRRVAEQKGLPVEGKNKEGLVTLLLNEKIEVSFTSLEDSEDTIVCKMRCTSLLLKGAKNWTAKQDRGPLSRYVFFVGQSQVNLTDTAGKIAIAHALPPGTQLEIKVVPSPACERAG